MAQMNSETDILICGKYPDWMLIEEAKMNGVKIIFVDKASDLFSRPVSDSKGYTRKPAFSYQVPLVV